MIDLFAGSPSQSRIRSTALPKGEPLAVHAKFTVMPRPLPLGEVAPQVTERARMLPISFYSSCVSKPLPVSTCTLVKPAALMAAAASSKPKVRLLMSWESEVMMTLPPIFCHSPSSHGPG